MKPAPASLSVRRPRNDLGVYVARMICSDEACAEQALAEAQTLEELGVLVCDCDCILDVIGFPDHIDDPNAAVLSVSFVRRARSDLAA